MTASARTARIEALPAAPTLAHPALSIAVHVRTEIAGRRGRLHLGRQRRLARLRRARLWQRLRPYEWIVPRRLSRWDDRA
ncbi:MAG: hypothetical protein ABW179_00990 [Methylobacterium sp.]